MKYNSAEDIRQECKNIWRRNHKKLSMGGDATVLEIGMLNMLIPELERKIKEDPELDVLAAVKKYHAHLMCVVNR